MRIRIHSPEKTKRFQAVTVSPQDNWFTVYGFKIGRSVQKWLQKLFLKQKFCSEKSWMSPLGLCLVLGGVGPRCRRFYNILKPPRQILNKYCMYVLSPFCLSGVKAASDTHHKKSSCHPINSAPIRLKLSGILSETHWCFKGTVQRDFGPPFFVIIRTSLGHWPTG